MHPTWWGPGEERRGQLYVIQLLCCALRLCHVPVHLILLSHMIFTTDWSLQHLSLYAVSPFQSKERVDMLFFAGEECPSPLAAVAGAGRSWSWTSWWSLFLWMVGLGTHSSCGERPLCDPRGGPGHGTVGYRPRFVSEHPHRCASGQK